MIGGGDTGTDCIGTALRHGCKSLVNFELLDQPPEKRAPTIRGRSGRRSTARTTRTRKSIAQFGADPRNFAVVSKEFAGWRRAGRLGTDHRGRVATAERRAEDDRGRRHRRAARGRPRPARDGLPRPGGVSRGERSASSSIRGRTIEAAHGKFATSVPGVFAAGDCRRGQSLVVWAINEGRGAARAVDEFLMGESQLPAPKLSLGGATG